jgi:hypothetical protein
MGVGEILLVCVGLYVLVRLGRRVAFGRSPSRIRPLTVLGVAAIIGGLAIFGGRHVHPVVHVRSDHGAPAVDELVGEFSSDEPDRDLWRSDAKELSALGREFKEITTRKWLLISLGTVLVISGAMLASRGRARPIAFKAFTVLGLAAAGYALVTFVTSAPRHTWDRGGDRIVKNNRTITIGVDLPTDKEPAATAPRKKPKKAHAKRPTTRPKSHESTEELIAKIPPRAGEIPVADELAKLATKTEPASEPVTPPSPQPAAPAPSPLVGAAEPRQSTEPALAAAETATAAEQPKPAEPDPTPPPAKTPETSGAPEPVKVSTPEPSPVSAAAPVPSAALPINKPVAKETPAAKPPVRASIQPAVERPAWIEKRGELVDSVYRVSVNSGLYVTVPECQRTLDLEMKRAADQYIDDYLGEGAKDVVDISLGYLRKHVKKAEFNEVIESETVGPMQQIHALLEFDDGARADFQRRWHAAVVSRRLWHVGAVTGLILALLGTLYGYLRLDLRTGGTHKGQLQLAAALVALIVTAGALLVQSKLPF